MDEHLMSARASLDSLATFMKGKKWQEVDYLAAAVYDLIFHLESQKSPETPGHRHQVTPATKDKTYLWCPACLEEAETPGPEMPSSPEPQATTAPSTTDDQWGAAEYTDLKTMASWQLGRPATASLVGLVFMCAAQRDALPEDEQILALAAQARRSISVRVGSSQSAAILLSDDARSGFGLSHE